MNLPRISLDAVSLQYPCGTRALHGVHLQISAGSAFGIVGPNGAGKSTLLNMMCGFCQPTTGTVHIGDVLVERRSLDHIRSLLGVLFQHADDQLFQATVIDDIGFGLRNRGIPYAQAESQAREILRRFDLESIAQKSPFQLSSGQKRFAALCGVLVMEPQVLLLDEPTSDLDPRNRRRFLDVFRKLSMTRLVISHDLDFVWDACDTVAILDKGQVVAQGPTRELLQNESLLLQHSLELPLRLQ
jgi:cobalt/nickel transport system ATP-binding protein